MRISDVRIEGFGVWHGLKLEELPAGITVIYGPNEAGKTTLLQFMRTALYGFSPERKLRYLPPLNGGRPGGVVRAVTGDGTYEVRRFADLPPGPHGDGDCEVTAPDGQRYGQPFLEQLLSGVDEQIFNNVFAVGLREIQELGTLQDTRAAEELYKLSSGLDRVSLFDVIRDLDLNRRRIVGDEQRASQLQQLLAEKEKLLAEIQRRGDEGMRWSQMSSRRQELQRELDELTAEGEQLSRGVRITELALEIHSPWLERKRVEEQVRALGTLTPVPPNALEQLEELHRQTERRLAQKEVSQRQISTFRAESKSLAINRPLWANASKIEALGEMQPWLASGRAQIERLTAELGPAEAELIGRLEKMGYKGGAKLDTAPRISPKMLSGLKFPAKMIRRLALKQRKTQEHRDTCREELNEIQKQIEMAMTSKGHDKLPVAIETLGATVSQLRRRLQSEERLEQLARHQQDLEYEIKLRGERQVLSPQALLGLGGLFIIGVMFVLSGLTGSALFGISTTASFAMALLGLGAIAAAAGTKTLIERASQQRWHVCRSQLERLKTQIDRVTEERDELDRALPSGGGPLTSRLQVAESELAAFEDLLPLEEQRKIAHERVKKAEEVSSQAAHGLREAYNRWKAALRDANLPDALTPGQVKLLAGQSSHLGHMQSHLSSRREELVERKRELDAFSERLFQMFGLVGLTPVEVEPEGQLRELMLALGEQRKLVERMKTLRRDFWREKRRSRGLEHNLDQLRQQRQSLLQHCQAADENAIRERLKKIEQAGQLDRRREDLVRQIRSAIGTHANENEVAAELEKHDRDHLTRRADHLRTRFREVQTAQRERHETRGELAAEMKSLVEDRRLAEAKLQLSCIERQVQDLGDSWRTLAIASRVLDHIRKHYEAQRQPEVLREASSYLDKLTEGHYTRIWTPLGQQALRVDDKEGRTLPLDVLSCGTREAVFLSLRLALVSAYARRGATLPLVLDDVLVNLDVRRARCAATVLREFSRTGHQMLVFTCHEHIVKIFKTLKCDVRNLPGVHAIEDVPEPAPEPIPAPAPAPTPEPVKVTRKKAAPAERPAPPPVVATTPEPVLAPVRADIDWDEPRLAPLVEPVHFRIDPPHAPPRAVTVPETVVQMVEAPQLAENYSRSGRAGEGYDWYVKRSNKFSWDEPKIWWEGDGEEAA